MNRLSTKKIDNLKPRNIAYRVNDGNGLYLNIGASGVKSWVFRYKSYLKGVKRDRWFTIGKYPQISLAQARAEQRRLMFDISNGIDVQQAKITKRAMPKKKSDSKFGTLAHEWIETRKSRVIEATWDKDWSRLNRFILPQFADMDIEEIMPKDLLEHLTKVAQTNGAETSHRTLRQVGAIYEYAMTIGKIKYNITSGMTKYLPKPHEPNRSAILDKTVLGKYIYTVENDNECHDLVGCAIRLLPHIFVRHSEMLSMRWEDIDWKKNTWTYSVSKTKGKGVDTHIVFLSEQVLAILEEIKGLTSDKEYVFFSGQGTKNQQLSQRATLYRIRELGFDRETVSPHGFRASARTLGEDELKFDTRTIEMCLAHKTKEVLGTAYDRAKRLDDRKRFYQSWSDFLIDCKKQYQKTRIKRVK